MRVALVSREVYPLCSGGIGQFVSAAARLLSRVAEVTVVTTSVFEAEYQRLRQSGDPRLPGKDVRVVFVAEPSAEDAAAWVDVMHCYGARVYERLREVYPDGGPELIEFPDYLGEAFVTLQAAGALDPFLAHTRVCVRIHTSAEITNVLDGHLRGSTSWRGVFAMERYSLANADRLLWPGGDVLGTYDRFYRGALAPAAQIRHPYVDPMASASTGEAGGGPRAGIDSRAAPAGGPGSPLRILYAGRLERRKGVHNLVRAVTGLVGDDFRLTLLGGDTPTAPLGVSMRAQLALAIADDERVSLQESRSRGGVAEAILEHHLVVIPSLWECWPYAALEALALNRPVLGTPVGGLVELIEPGVSGWLSPGTDAAAIQGAFEELLGGSEEVERILRTGGPRARALALSDEGEILDSYQQLAQVELPRSRPSRSSAVRATGAPGTIGREGASRMPLVSAIVPYYRSSRYVAEAVESLIAQSYPRMEIVLVNDGSFQDQDWILAEVGGRLPVIVVSQMNAGLGAARNFGVRQSRGRYFFPLDADNLAEPDFVARCVAILEQRQDVAYVTSWSRYIEADGTPRQGSDIGYEPLGNHAALNAEQNVSGDAAAVLRRWLFDIGFSYSEELTSFEDWHLYRRLQRAGHFGAVIPERLLRYRVREDSMQAQIGQPYRERLHGEIDALIRENEMQWTSSSA